MEIRKVGVVGCGLMGAGIAETCARAGFETIVAEVTDEILERGMARLKGSMQAAVDKKKMEAAWTARVRGKNCVTISLRNACESATRLPRCASSSRARSILRHSAAMIACFKA